MYLGPYRVDGLVRRIMISETQYRHLLPHGVYALEQALGAMFQSKFLVSEEVHFDRQMTAAGLLRTQWAFYHACVDDDLFATSVIQRLPSYGNHLTDEQIREKLNKAFLAAFDKHNQLRAKLAGAINASEQELFHIVTPGSTVQDVMYFSHVQLVYAILSHPQIVLDCVPWPKLLFKKTK